MNGIWWDRFSEEFSAEKEQMRRRRGNVPGESRTGRPRPVSDAASVLLAFYGASKACPTGSHPEAEKTWRRSGKIRGPGRKGRRLESGLCRSVRRRHPGGGAGGEAEGRPTEGRGPDRRVNEKTISRKIRCVGGSYGAFSEERKRELGRRMERPMRASSK